MAQPSELETKMFRWEAGVTKPGRVAMKTLGDDMIKDKMP